MVPSSAAAPSSSSLQPTTAADAILKGLHFLTTIATLSRHHETLLGPDALHIISRVAEAALDCRVRQAGRAKATALATRLQGRFHTIDTVTVGWREIPEPSTKVGVSRHVARLGVRLALAYDQTGLASQPFKEVITHTLEGSSDHRAAYLGLRGQRPDEVESAFTMVAQPHRHQVLLQALEAFMDLHQLSPVSCAQICPPLPTLLTLVRHVRPYRLHPQDLSPPHLWRHQVLLACQVVATLTLDGRYHLHPQLVAQEVHLLSPPSTLSYALQGGGDVTLVGELCTTLRTLGLDQGNDFTEAQAFLLRMQMEDGGWPPPSPPAPAPTAATPPPSSGLTAVPPSSASPLEEARARLMSTASAIRGLCRIRTRGHGPVFNGITDKLRRVLAPYSVITADGKVALKPPPTTAICCGSTIPLPLSSFDATLRQAYHSTSPYHLDPFPPDLVASSGGGGGQECEGGDEVAAVVPVSRMTIGGLTLNEIMDTSLTGSSKRRLHELLLWRQRQQQQGIWEEEQPQQESGEEGREGGSSN